MTLTDPISDMLTRIRNAGNAKLTSVDIPGSLLKTEIAKILKNEGYIKNFKFTKDGKQGVLRIYLKYDKRRQHTIRSLERVSKPSRRVYVKGKDVRSVYNGLGIAIVSTSKGVLTDKQARSEKIGGEILCNIW